jgi:HK97 family phage prohead protease
VYFGLFFCAENAPQLCANEMKKNEIILSDHSTNSHGFAVLTSGIDTERFLKNPVMLFNHDPNNVPGSWGNLKVEGDNLIAEPLFDDDEDAVKLSKKFEKGTIKGASIGLEPLKVELNVPGFPKDLPVITKSELMEASLTPLPSNSNALRMYDNTGKQLSASDIKILLSINPNNNEMKKLQFFIAAMAVAGIELRADVTEDELLKSVQKLSAKHAEVVEENTTLVADKMKLTVKLTALETSAKEGKTKAEKELVAGAVKAGKITADKTAQYEKLAAADYETTKQIIDGMKAHTSLSSQLNADKTSTTEKYANWGLKQLHKEAPIELARIKAEEPDRFKQLIKENA